MCYCISENSRTSGGLTHSILNSLYIQITVCGVGAVYTEKQNPNALDLAFGFSASPSTSCLQLKMHRPTVPASQDQLRLCGPVLPFRQVFEKSGLEYFWIMKVGFFAPSHTGGFSRRPEDRLLNPWKPLPHNTAFFKEYWYQEILFLRWITQF